MRILFITTRPPWPPTNGGFQRSNLIHRALRTLGDVDVALVGFRIDDKTRVQLEAEYGLVAYHPGNGPPPNRLWKRLARTCPDLKRYWPAPAASDWVGKRYGAEGYDVTVGRYFESVCKVEATRFSPLCLDVDDVDHQRISSGLNLPETSSGERLKLRLTAALVRSRFRRALRAVDHAWVPKPEDLAALTARASSLLPNLPFSLSQGIPPVPPTARGSAIAFIGNLGYKVNARALNQFVAHTLPEIRSRVPSARLLIAGIGGREDDIEAWRRSAGVEVLGAVESVEEVYAAARLTVCPIDEGGGTKIKVLESLLYGRPVVSSTHSAQGIALDGILTGDRPAQFAESCAALLQEPDRAASLGARGRACLLKSYSFEAFERRVHDDIRAAVTAHKGAGRRPVEKTRANRH